MIVALAVSVEKLAVGVNRRRMRNRFALLARVDFSTVQELGQRPRWAVVYKLQGGTRESERFYTRGAAMRFRERLYKEPNR